MFNNMMQALYNEKGASLRIEILHDKPIQDFIEAHASVLDSSFKQIEMSDIMRRRLQRSDYIFSGLKTFHELNEAFPSLLDDNGNRKSFERFLNDVQKINKTYNQNYLRAEYNFASASAEMAARWEQFMDDGDRYYLQYRTAADGKVRPEHAALHGVTLPIDDPFWEQFYPPNGWNCRCSVTQVRKSKYPATPHNEAMALGEIATQRDTRQMFRFNPGKEQKTFPAHNPYTISRCKTCKLINGKLAKGIPDNDLCAACRIIHDYSSLRGDIKPPQVDTYKQHHNGKVFESPYHGPEELADNLDLAKRTADLLEERVYLLPRLNPNNPTEFKLRDLLLPEDVYKDKNSDFLIGGKLYEGKTLYKFSGGNDRDKQKNAIENHIKKAKKQAPNIILDLPDVFIADCVDKTIRNYLNRTSTSRIIIVFHKGVGTVYQK